MATAADRLAEAHRLAQHRLGIETVQFIRAAAPLLDLENVDATFERWLRVVVPQIQAQSLSSARLAAEFARRVRELEIGADPTFSPVLKTANVEQITTSMTVTGPVEMKRLAALGRLLPQIRDLVFVSTAGAAQRLTLEGGRRTIVETVGNDDRAVGWSRTGSGHSCAFCSMLISRGPVYKSDTVRFRSHDNCSCGARPVYDGGSFDGWTPQARQLQALWKETTRGESGQGAINAFRRAVEAA